MWITWSHHQSDWMDCWIGVLERCTGIKVYWKDVLESRSLRVNILKTMVMISGPNLAH